MMRVLPIVERELRVASRRRATYWGRVLVASLTLVIFTWMMLFLLPEVGITPVRYGMYLFRGLLVVGMLYCCLGSAGATADCLSREKREGTLGLLFLTDLKGYDIVLGKLAATSVNAVYALLAMIPVLALSIQLGGVTYRELAYGAVMLLNTMFFSLAVGMMVSALSRNERKALFGTMFCLVLAALGPGMLVYILSAFTDWFDSGPKVLFTVLALSPMYPLGFVLFPPTGFLTLPAWTFWFSSLWIHGVSWALLVITSLLLPRVWRVRESHSGVALQQERVEQWAYGSGARRVALRRRLLDINPFLWLMHREWGKPLYVWIYVAAVMGTWLWGNYEYGDVMFDLKSGLPGLWLIQSFLKIWVVSESCTRLAEDRRIGALELLLSTPLSERDMVRGQWLALRRQFAKPLLVFVLLGYLILSRMFTPGIAGASLVMLVLDLVTLGWVGMWLGLTAKSTNRAISGTVGLVLVLPWLLLAGWMYLAGFVHRLFSLPFAPSFLYEFGVWLLIGVLVDGVFGFGWARRRLHRDFRRVATPRFQAEGAMAAEQRSDLRSPGRNPVRMVDSKSAQLAG